MSYIELYINDLSRMLSIMSEHFGDKKMTKSDFELRLKLEAMHKAEVEWERDRD